MSCEDLKNWKPIAQDGCSPCPPGLGNRRVGHPYPVYEHGKPSRFYPVELTMESEFAVPVGDGVYRIMTAREILESENREAKELAKSIIKQ